MLSYFAEINPKIKQNLRKIVSTSSRNLRCTFFRSPKSRIEKGMLWCIESRAKANVISRSSEVWEINTKCYVELVQPGFNNSDSCHENGSILYVNRINHEWWGFWYEFLKVVEICFCFNNMKRNTGIDAKPTWLRKTVFFSVIDLFIFSSIC